MLVVTSHGCLLTVDVSLHSNILLLYVRYLISLTTDYVTMGWSTNHQEHMHIGSKLGEEPMFI